MPNLADPFAELAASNIMSPVKLSPPPPPQRTASGRLGCNASVGPASADPPPVLPITAHRVADFKPNAPAPQLSQGDTSSGLSWYDSELQKHKEAAKAASARADALEKRLAAQEVLIQEARASKERDSAVLKELAIHFQNSRVLRCEAMALQYAERLKASGMEDLGSLLEEVVAREHTVARMLTDATYLTALPLKGLSPPPAPSTQVAQQGLNRTGSSNLHSLVTGPKTAAPIQRTASMPVHHMDIDLAAADPRRLPGRPDEYGWSRAAQSTNDQQGVSSHSTGKYEWSSDHPPGTYWSRGQSHKAANNQAPATTRAIHKVAKRLGMQ